MSLNFPSPGKIDMRRQTFAFVNRCPNGDRPIATRVTNEGV
jgi:hypothetical protein